MAGKPVGLSGRSYIGHSNGITFWLIRFNHFDLALNINALNFRYSTHKRDHPSGSAGRVSRFGMGVIKESSQ
ncbi:hypothetical protein HNQ59_003738 [Chitinivorax tropicus]|uniref:Uncharacterized protein n=1 Tax=Chitinivorax tropicus TaxID=714531 RepID=A0A840MTK3_9PROT|nr:hypothetical protein [Chitinivorax tropicus]MBB5020419.1 hypothetical protein [Chitinivorax tropicus]